MVWPAGDFCIAKTTGSEALYFYNGQLKKPQDWPMIHHDVPVTLDYFFITHHHHHKSKQSKTDIQTFNLIPCSNFHFTPCSSYTWSLGGK